ncbi:MAG: sigma-70 family RNA polymerase sigma factor [Sedimentisphaerales bacterium]|nr:sigma-70 family RNA polymerase sigma factor [Sedimentisphaerales bacterium]
MANQRQINVEDEVLVQKWRQGDARAIERLVGKYQGRIYNVILKICSNPDDAAELTQDTFVKIIENISGFESRSSFYTWVFRIAVNLTLNYRKRKLLKGFTSLDASSGRDDDLRGSLGAVLLDEKTPDPTEVAENRELCELVQKAIDKLDEEHRTMIVLRDIEGMDYAQIADVLGVELGTVKSRLSRARTALRQILEAFVR